MIRFLALTFVLAVGVANAQLTVTTTTLPTTNVGANYPNTQLTATGGTPPYTWTATGLAGCNNFALSTAGVLSDPSPVNAGSCTPNFTVTDSVAGTASRAIQILVDPGQITQTSISAATINTAYSPMTFTTTPGGWGTGPYTWTVAPTPPTGMSFSAAGVLSGTPIRPILNSVFNVTITDSLSAKLYRNYTIDVLPVYSFGSGNVVPANCSTFTGFPSADKPLCTLTGEFPLGSFAVPAVGESWTDQNFGTVGTVIARYGGTLATRAIHAYAQPSSFSATGRYALINIQGTGDRVINATTGAVVRASVTATITGASVAMWDAFDDDLFYYPSGGDAKIRQYRVSTGVDTVVKDYATSIDPRTGSLYTFTNIYNGGTGDTSGDNWLPFYSDAASHNACIVHLVAPWETQCADYRIPVNGVTPTDIVNPANGYVYVSKGIDSVSGHRYIIAHTFPAVIYHEGATNSGRLILERLGPEYPAFPYNQGPIGNTDNICNGLTVIPATTPETCFDPQHNDTFQDTDGQQYEVVHSSQSSGGVGNSTRDTITYFRLNAGQCMTRTPSEPASNGCPLGAGGRIDAILYAPLGAANDGHLGCAKKASVCVWSEHRNGGYPTPPRYDSTNFRDHTDLTTIVSPIVRDNMIYVFKGLGLEMRALIKNRTIFFENDDYWSYPRANISNDGSHVLFDSNFGITRGENVLVAPTGFGPAQPGWTNYANTRFDTNTNSIAGASGSFTGTGCPPNNFQNGYTQNGVTQSPFLYSDQCLYLIGASSGGTFDSKRNRLWITGGGHVATFDNEMAYYDLNASPITVNRATAPSIVNTASCPEPNPSDGSPQSKHSYQGVAYIPDTDKIFYLGGGTYCQTSPFIAWLFDPRVPAAGTWNVSAISWSSGVATVTTSSTNTISTSNMVTIAGVTPSGYNVTQQATVTDATHFTVPIAANPGAYSAGGTVKTGPWAQMATAIGSPPTDGMRCVWNSTRQKIDCLESSTYWQEFDPIPTSPTYNTWTVLYSNFCGGVTGCTQGAALDIVYDPVRKLMIAVGGTSNIVNGGPGNLLVTATDFSTGTTYGTQDWTTQVTGCSLITTATATFGGTPIKTGQYPGLAYDPARRAIAIYPGSGNSILLLNPTTRQCTTHTFTGGPGSTFSNQARGIGTFGRFVYSPVSGSYFTILSTDQNLYGLKLDVTPTYGLGSSTTVCLDQDGDGYGTGQVQIGPFIDLAIGAGNTVISGSYGFGADAQHSTAVGRHIIITGGPGFIPGDYMITSVASGAATLSASPGTQGSFAGLWSSPGCLGPDADDLDAARHSGADMLSQWGSVSAWLNHLGYNVTGKIYYLNQAATLGALPNGSHSGAACTVGAFCDTNPGASAQPFLSWDDVYNIIRPNDAVIVGQGWNNSAGTRAVAFPIWTSANSGTSGNPYLFLSYPGETGILDVSSAGGASRFTIGDSVYIVIDGVTCQLGCSIKGGSADNDASFAEQTNYGGVLIQSVYAHIIQKHIHGQGVGDGLGILSQFNGMLDMTFEDSVLHQGLVGGQHNSYVGSRYWPSAMIQFTNIIAYNNSSAGENLHFNGRIYNLELGPALIYNGAIANITFQEGISHSYIHDVIAFGGGGGNIDQDTYPGKIGLSSCGLSTNLVCTCPGSASHPGPMQAFSVCPFDETDNLWENNTFYQPNVNACATNSCTSSTSQLNLPNMVMFNSSDVASITHGGIFRNNHFINYGNNNGNLALHITDSGGSTGCGASCQGWIAALKFSNNIFYQTSASHATGVLLQGNTVFTCAGMSTTAGTGSGVALNAGCQNAAPLFLNESPAFWSQPSLFNFHLSASSPGTHAGTQLGYPAFDNTGLTFTNPTPSIGALELVPTSCNITTTSLPGGTVGAAYSQTMTFSQCATPVTWGLFTGSLPAWATMNTSTGVISGTPNAAATTSFVVKVTDNVGNQDTQALSITIAAAGTGGMVLKGTVVTGGPVVHF